MKESTFDISDLLLWRISGELRQGELQLLEDWLNASPANRRLMEALDNDEYFNEHWKKFNEIDVDTSWRILQARVAARGQHKGTAVYFLRRYAAVWVLLLLVILGLILHSVSTNKPPAIVVAPSSPGLSFSSLTLSCEGHPTIAFDSKTEDSLITMENISFRRQGNKLFVHYLADEPASTTNNKPFTLISPAGSKYEVTLPDGTTALMNARAELTVSAGYGLRNRNVRLRGEVYFEVKPIHEPTVHLELPSLAFVVSVIPPDALAHLFKSGVGLDITDKGTSFYVRANEKDKSIRAILTKGNIVVRRPGAEPQSINPDNAYVLDETGLSRILPSISLPGSDSWKKDEFNFKNEPVSTIMDELSRWYNVQVSYEANFADSFLVSGPRNQPINFLLDQMKATHHFDYRMSHDTVYVSH